VTKEQQVYKAEIEPLLDKLYKVCHEHDLNMLAFVQVPREDAPTTTECFGHLNEQAAPTMLKMYDLANSRPVIETYDLPS